MKFRDHSHGFHQGLKDPGPEVPALTWFQPDSQPPASIDTGDNGAGNGGAGYFSGYLIDSPYAAFEPVNVAESASHATALAHQTNIDYLNQAAVQIAGIGGEGGDSNVAIGGSAGGQGSIGSEAVATGDNGAGNGGNGYFAGALVDAPVAIFDPINIAIAGFHGTAVADQSNAVQFDQSAFQVAGIGGNGGNGNAAIGGSVVDGTVASAHHATLGTSQAADFGSIGSGGISSGDNQAGNGGDGYFSGSLVHTSVALYDPINIAVAGYDSTSQAVQSNNVQFDQFAFQMAGVGGHGGGGNAAIGGAANGLSSILGLIGSDVISTGGNSAGAGGDGHFAGSLVDLNIAIYAPINIAIAGPNSTAEADQTNNVMFEQGATQIAGIGGDAGHGNAALGGEAHLQLLSDWHLPGHAMA
jgi:hypothetical protein